MFNFEIKAKSTTAKARSGLLKTAHGEVNTPVFMPVGTLGTVKSLTPEELVECGAQIILGNTYHLYLRPGCDVFQHFSGLHGFMNWDRPILTDSGGFQVFSLAKLRKITEDGVAFQSHIDGSSHLLTPERSVEIQLLLGADIIMCLDECIAHTAGRDDTQKALERTTRWAQRCKKVWEKEGKHALFGIVQGGMYTDFREISCNAMIDIGFNGYAIGGLSVGEPKDVMLEVAAFTLAVLPDSQPKYVMGTGTPSDLVELVALGADMFDCVLPTRNARNGQMFSKYGTINISNSRFKYDAQPVEADCRCYTCRHFSRAYLRHLYMNKELLAYRLNTIHNIHYYLCLMQRMRDAINNDKFAEFKKDFYRHRTPDQG
jgi:queuine tRNA-ribosyltransferase